MDKKLIQNIQLGLFIIIGTVFLIVAFYKVGSKRNLFGSTFQISSQFHNVSGLMPGNNVRFSGIDVGTVESVEIIQDNKVKVVMVIDSKVKNFILKNAVASIGTDGLMGNKLININAQDEPSEIIENGDVIQSVQQVETDAMVRTLNETNENIKDITANLLNFTDKINHKNNIWSLLKDTIVAGEIQSAINQFKMAGIQTKLATENLKWMTENIRKGEGSLGALITDTLLSSKLTQIMGKLETFSDTITIISGDISNMVKRVESGKGSIGILLKDTTLAHNLNKSVENLREGSKGFDEIIEALKHNFLVRKYFKKKEEEKE